MRLLYEVVRRLLTPVPTASAADERRHEPSSQDSQLIVDPTIDAWEHTGIYPQGYTPPQNQAPQLSETTQVSPAPQFGRPSMDTMPISIPAAAEGLFFGPPCTGFSRPWQPGCLEPSPLTVTNRLELAQQPSDPWAASEGGQASTADNVPIIPVLPIGTILRGQGRAICSCLCRCGNPCILTRAGHALHYCRECINQHPVGEPRSGA